ncbi:MAG TPA: class I SAM-dependent methyltransferase [Candidatus Limnocylindrales bacterium]|nr:class I SAM-dependent methyltransferase [Candidatus Limnocylindrales bacterium]
MAAQPNTNATTERYDRFARDYLRHWAPVIEPAGIRLLEAAAGPIAAAIAHARAAGRQALLLDVGTGTGPLARAAVRRWPELEVAGLDASAGMLAVAEELSRELLTADQRARVRWLQADAEATGLASDTVDIALSAFVLQLVPDRSAALRELLRVLRPDGILGYVTWLAPAGESPPFAPSEAFDEAVLDLEVEEPEPEDDLRAGDLVSVGAAAAQLRRAGFRAVRATQEALLHHWQRDEYLAYKLYDEGELLAILDAAQRVRLEEEARRRIAALPDAALDWRAPLVQAWGRKPALAAAPAPPVAPVQAPAAPVSAAGSRRRAGRARRRRA